MKEKGNTDMQQDAVERIMAGIRASLDAQGIAYRDDAAEEIMRQRKSGRRFSIGEHIRGMVHSQLSNQTKWKNIEPKLPMIEELFFHFDKGSILARPTGYFRDGLFALECGNISTARQMEHLHHNIGVLERIETTYGSIDAYYERHEPDALARMLSDGANDGYKLKYIGYALAWQYLKNMGMDGAKPDVHLRRILGRERLGFSALAVAPEREVIAIVVGMTQITGFSHTLINDLLWHYCASGSAEICRATPRCGICGVRMYCRYPENNAGGKKDRKPHARSGSAKKKTEEKKQHAKRKRSETE